VAVTAAAGDNGYGVVYPAASPYVTVGRVAPRFVQARGTPRGWSETAWNQSGATGSGCSAYEASRDGSMTTGCSRRTDNDVAADANPNTGVAVYDTYGGDHGWGVFGGTSVGSSHHRRDLRPGQARRGPAPTRPSTRTCTPAISTTSPSGTRRLVRRLLPCSTATVGYDGPTGWERPMARARSGPSATPSHRGQPGYPAPARRVCGSARVTITARDSSSAQALSVFRQRPARRPCRSAPAVPSPGPPRARGVRPGSGVRDGRHRDRGVGVVHGVDRAVGVGAITSRPCPASASTTGAAAPAVPETRSTSTGAITAGRAQAWSEVNPPGQTAPCSSA